MDHGDSFYYLSLSRSLCRYGDGAGSAGRFPEPRFFFVKSWPVMLNQSVRSFGRQRVAAVSLI